MSDGNLPVCETCFIIGTDTGKNLYPWYCIKCHGHNLNSSLNYFTLPSQAIIRERTKIYRMFMETKSKNLKIYPFKVTVEIIVDQNIVYNIDNCLDWLETNVSLLGIKWVCEPNSEHFNAIDIYFSNGEDANAFKLKF